MQWDDIWLQLRIQRQQINHKKERSQRRRGKNTYISKNRGLCQCDADGSVQKFLVATRIFSLPCDSGSFSCKVAVHLTAWAIRPTLSITSGESRIITVPSGRRIRSISTIKSTRLHLQKFHKAVGLFFWTSIKQFICWWDANAIDSKNIFLACFNGYANYDSSNTKTWECYIAISCRSTNWKQIHTVPLPNKMISIMNSTQLIVS